MSAATTVFQFPAPAEPRPERAGGASLRDHAMDLELLADTVEALDDEKMTPELGEDLTRDVKRAIADTRKKVDRTGALKLVSKKSFKSSGAHGILGHHGYRPRGTEGIDQ